MLGMAFSFKCREEASVFDPPVSPFEILHDPKCHNTCVCSRQLFLSLTFIPAEFFGSGKFSLNRQFGVIA